MRSRSFLQGVAEQLALRVAERGPQDPSNGARSFARSGAVRYCMMDATAEEAARDLVFLSELTPLLWRFSRKPAGKPPCWGSPKKPYTSNPVVFWLNFRKMYSTVVCTCSRRVFQHSLKSLVEQR